jgi:L-iditol 2-dehydrogenase
VILAGTRDDRLAIGGKLGADQLIKVKGDGIDHAAWIRSLTGGIGVDYVLECAGTKSALDLAIAAVSRGGKICLAAFPAQPVELDVASLVRNNVYVYGIRGEGRSATGRALALMSSGRLDARPVHTHTFPFTELLTALQYARNRTGNAIKVVVAMDESDGEG